MHVHVRLDVLATDDSSRLQAWLDLFSDVYVIYREVSDKVHKVHLQGWAVIDDVDYDHIKESFVTSFKDTHSRFQRAFTVARSIKKLVRYVAKDKNLEFKKGVSDGDQKTAEDESFKKKQTFQENVEARWALVRPEYDMEWYKSDKTMWNADYLARKLNTWLLTEYKCLRRTFEFSTVRKYVNYLLIEVVGAEIITKLWTKGASGYFLA